MNLLGLDGYTALAVRQRCAATTSSRQGPCHIAFFSATGSKIRRLDAHILRGVQHLGKFTVNFRENGHWLDMLETSRDVQ